MKKLIIACLGLFYLVSCTDQLRIDERQMAEDVTYGTSAKYLLAGSIDGIAQWYQRAGIREDRHNAVVQYYQQLFSVKSQTYEEFSKAPENWNTELELLKPVKAGLELAVIEGEPFIEGALLVLKSFMFAYLTNQWGDVPYTDALRGREGIFFPKFDPQREIYDGMLADLDRAIMLMESTSNYKEPQFDLIYSGNTAKWVKFANSLKIRLLVSSYEAYKKNGVDNGPKIGAIVSSGKYFTAVSDNAAYLYLGTANYNSWPLGYYNDNSGNELTRRKPSTTFVNTLKTLNDPRLNGWIAPALIPWANAAATVQVTDRYNFTYEVKQQDINGDTNGDGVPDGQGNIEGYPVGELYVGMPIGFGEGNPVRYGGTVPPAGAYDNYRTSSFGKLFVQDKSPLLKLTLLQACETNLSLAEAVQRGWITGNAKTYYDNGVTLNMQRWDIPDAEITAYLASLPVVLDGNNNLEKIATQKWLALFTVGIEAYFEYRRTKLPSVIGDAVPSGLGNDFPERWRYPTAEKDNNTDQYNEAVARQGVDDQYTKIWILK
ncbi:SusD/RagB family nutrient-binding outer membrane lipoprotein [Gaoshiqia sp. Z1-71]|uniref:SusD/RagB family nutrient-binding outer membrane lipoprotein n=1 Tax=Gaoshiqia hydrogeniformans TaxID=3290090 RepID=UPI003BF847B6